MSEAGWKFWIDRGGTFTDAIARAPDGQTHALKLPSDAPGQYPDAAAESIRRVLASHGQPDDKITEIRMGTTVATNALLERTGPVTALIINRGLGDLLSIGTQQRPDIFALKIRRPAPLYSYVAEVAGRLDSTGQELEALNLDEAQQQLQELQRSGVTAIAICLMHAWQSSRHERELARIATEVGFAQISMSHAVSPLIRMVSRGVTAVTDAYLSPVLRNYVDQFQTALEQSGLQSEQLLFMQSNGGLVSPAFFSGKDALLSGPAGGVIGMAESAARADRDCVIGFDMGGTSTDVSLYAGQPEVAASVEVAGLELISPTLKVHTIAAGGGSILKYENGRLQVGPESAGAMPGPMSYGHGGPLTITDANLLLGRIQPEHFPAVFGTSGNESLATEAVAHAFGNVARQINASRSEAYTPERAAQGFIRIAVENMANAIRQVSTQRGLNPAEFVLCCFGGAAGQHACELADTLGIREILIDPYAGVLSAWGMGHAQLSVYRQASIEEVLSPAALERAATTRQELAAQCRAELLAQQQSEQQLHTDVWLDLQRAGSDTTLSLPWRSDAALEPAFFAEHRARFGFSAEGDAIKIVSLRVEVASRPETIERNSVGDPRGSTARAGKSAQPRRTDLAKPATVSVYCHDQWLEVPVFARVSLAPGAMIAGPALIVEANSTTWLDPDWSLTVNAAQQLVLSRSGHASLNAEAAEQFEPDPVMLEIYNRRFMHIASLMGTVLEKTAHSVNIKERLDFSCAIFDAAGNLLANAPHIPVHLGSMDDTIRHLIAEHRDALERGDCFAANAPYKGGTHLPDITVMSPLVDDHQQLQFIVASRAHHADIGGISPGSMPPLSQSIDEEGVVFDNVRIVTDENFLERDVRDRLADSPWPARNPDQNIADLKAQLAANERGLELLRKLLETRPAETKRYCGFLLDNAAENVRHAITRLSDGKFCYPLDNGQEIRVAVAIDRQQGTASIDFTGTSAALDNNFNAPTAVCQAAIMYVFRTLVDVDIPLNSGCKRPLRVIIPEGCMLNPSYPAAVVGGNVETSQCITDALFGALGVLAGSQGTMNNLSFGNDSYQYYETICGGAGAGPTFAGESAVQTHMTNSRITDPEVIETRFPVLLREFSVRQKSGGRGKHAGGNGVVRKLEFRATMHAAILSNHRLVRPFGLAGGEPGQPGKNWLVRAGGETESFAGILATTVHSGDMLVIETPGGGGYGPPDAT